MKVYLYCLLAALLGTTLAWGQEGDAPQGRPAAEDGVEVLTRGPVHEAFAGTVTFNPEPGIVVPKAPPEGIEELPPEQKPEGDNVAWIPGYWAWDDERTDFLWISGIWRNLPPGRQWVPGYWGETSEGFQWTSGYWADASASEIEYLAEPPDSVEVGPNIAASSPDQIWMPGCWLWRQNRYAWRPGYWSAGQQNWVWVPAYYAWTPRGYVFVDGYYDYAVVNRGLVFAPVYFHSRIYTQRRYSYSPVTVINLSVFGSQLFLRPTHQHYYFGDYYAANYANAGYHPWYSYNSRHHGYDPIYAHERWHHRQDRAWEQNIQADFQHRRDHEDARPPRTLAAQNALVASQGSSIQKGLVVAASLAVLAKSTDSPLRLKPVAQEERQTLALRGQEVKKFLQERQKLEAKETVKLAADPAATVKLAADPAKPSEPARIKFSKSPLVSRPVDQLDKNQAPPKRHEVLKPDLKVEPKPRVRTEVNTPKGKPDQPKVEPKPPTGKPDLPKVNPDLPKGKPDQPKVKPEQPKGKPDQPKFEPKPPKGKPDAPKGNLPGAKRTEPVPPKPKEASEKPVGKTPRAGEDPPNPTTNPKRDDPPQPKPPQPRVERPEPKPQPQPKVDRPEPKPQPQPKADRPEPKPQPQPKADRPEPKPQPQPKADRPEPKPQPPPRAEPPAKPPQGNPGAGPGPKPDKPKGKDK